MGYRKLEHMVIVIVEVGSYNGKLGSIFPMASVLLNSVLEYALF